MSCGTMQSFGMIQWLVLVLGLSLSNIAGNNLCILPGMISYTAGMGKWVYLLLGCIIAGLSCLLGVIIKRAVPLRFATQRLAGQTLLTIAILAVSIPATALTGGWLSGHILAELTGFPWYVGGLCMLLSSSVFALGYLRYLRKIIHYLSLLFLPLALLLFVYGCFLHQRLYWHSFDIADSWATIALVAYGACGFRIPLLWEVGTCMSHRPVAAVLLAMGSKLFELLIMLLPLSVLISLQLSGPLALTKAVGVWWGGDYEWVVDIILLSLFYNALIPAMVVNACQLSLIFRRSFRLCLLAALCVCVALMGIEFNILFFSLTVGAGLSLVALIFYTIQIVQCIRNQSTAGCNHS